MGCRTRLRAVLSWAHVKHLRGRDLSFGSRSSIAPKRPEPFLTEALTAAILASSQSRLSGSRDSTHHGFKAETGSGLGTPEAGNDRRLPHSLATLAPRPAGAPAPLPSVTGPSLASPPRELGRSCRTWRVSFPMVEVLPGGPGGRRRAKPGAGDTPRGLTSLLREWSEGAPARTGGLWQLGLAFFSPLFFSFLLLAAASAAAAILECGEGQGSLWTEGDNWAHTASCWGLLSPALSVNFGIFEMDKAWCQNRGGGWSLSTLLGGDVGFECTTWTNSFWQAALFWMQVTGDEVEQLLGALGTNYACFLIQLRANLTLEET